jgi:hypothetical protein
MQNNKAFTDFLRFIYEKHPTCLRPSVLGEPLFSIDDGCEVLNRLILSEQVQWWINGRRRFNPIIPVDILTAGNEASMISFIDEVLRLNNGEEVMFSAHNCHEAMPEIQHRSVPFLQKLFEHTGVCSNGVNVMMLGGKYTQTPAGVHNDPCDIFLMPLIGHKRLLTWDWHALDNNTGKTLPVRIPATILGALTKDLEASAHLYIGSPGDALYIPAGCWHINDYQSTKHNFSFGINVFKNSNFSSTAASIHRAHRGVLSETGTGELPSLCESGEVIGLPSEFRLYLERVSDAIRLNPLIRTSGAGFITGLKPDHSSPDFCRASGLRKSPHAKLFLLKEDDGRSLLISNGRVIRANFEPLAAEVITAVIDNGFCGSEVFATGKVSPEFTGLMDWMIKSGSVGQELNNEAENA